jgi:anti-sigma factor RsiW
MRHADASELLASFALDAVSTTEHDEIETHLIQCPRCRAELDGYREVAAAMGNSVEPLPEGLWTSIAARLPDRGDEEPPPMPSLASGESADASRPRRRPRPRGIASIGAVAVATAAVAIVLGIGLVRADNQVNHDSSLLANRAHPVIHTISAVQAALHAPGHKVIKLANGAADVASFVVTPDGRGYLVSTSLPSLPATEVYQLWGVVNQQAISLGLLGTKPTRSTFTMAGDASPSRLSITVEPAGGSITPSSPLVASGTV